jgi:sugar/nucleoside kinase (ribokinase family)
MRVLAIGNNTLDHVFSISRELEPGAKLSAAAHHAHPGGQAANAAVAMVHLGLDVHYVGAFGDDSAGERVRGALAHAGCRLDGCPTVPDCPNHSAVVLVANGSGERSIVMHKDQRLRLDPDVVRPEYVERASAVYVDGHESKAGARAAELARRFGRRVIADAERVTPELRGLLARVHELVAPLDVLTELTGADSGPASVLAATALGPEVVVATAGAGGSYGTDGGGEVIHQPAVPAGVIDTTGAGDAFHAGYVAARLHGAGLRASLEYASDVAAVKCARPGPQLAATDVRHLRWR